MREYGDLKGAWSSVDAARRRGKSSMQRQARTLTAGLTVIQGELMERDKVAGRRPETDGEGGRSTSMEERSLDRQEPRRSGVALAES